MRRRRSMVTVPAPSQGLSASGSPGLLGLQSTLFKEHPSETLGCLLLDRLSHSQSLHLKVLEVSEACMYGPAEISSRRLGYPLAGSRAPSVSWWVS